MVECGDGFHPVESSGAQRGFWRSGDRVISDLKAAMYIGSVWQHSRSVVAYYQCACTTRQQQLRKPLQFFSWDTWQKGSAHQVFEVMPHMEVIWDEELLQTPNTHDGLLQQVSQSSEYLVAKARKPSVELKINGNLPYVDDPSAILDLGIDVVHEEVDEMHFADVIWDQELLHSPKSHGLLLQLANGDELLHMQQEARFDECLFADRKAIVINDLISHNSDMDTAYKFFHDMPLEVRWDEERQFEISTHHGLLQQLAQSGDYFDENIYDDLVSDYGNFDDNLLPDQFGLHSNPYEVSETFSGKTVGQRLELTRCNHPIINPKDGKKFITDEIMLLNSHHEHSCDLEAEVHHNPDGGVGIQLERQTVIKNLKELCSLKQLVTISSQDYTDSGSDQCIPDETHTNPDLSRGMFDVTMEDTTSFDECHGNAEVLQIIIDLVHKRIEALEKKLIGSDKKIFPLWAAVKDSRRKVQQLENLVDELQFKFSCSLSHLGSICNTLAKPLIVLIGGYIGVAWLSSLNSFSLDKDLLMCLTPMISLCSYAYAIVLFGLVFACDMVELNASEVLTHVGDEMHANHGMYGNCTSRLDTRASLLQLLAWARVVFDYKMEKSITKPILGDVLTSTGSSIVTIDSDMQLSDQVWKSQLFVDAYIMGVTQKEAFISMSRRDPEIWSYLVMGLTLRMSEIPVLTMFNQKFSAVFSLPISCIIVITRHLAHLLIECMDFSDISNFANQVMVQTAIDPGLSDQILVMHSNLLEKDVWELNIEQGQQDTNFSNQELNYDSENLVIWEQMQGYDELTPCRLNALSSRHCNTEFACSRFGPWSKRTPAHKQQKLEIYRMLEIQWDPGIHRPVLIHTKSVLI